MAEKVVVSYDHDPNNLTQIWMAVSPGAPGDAEWKAAFRDTIGGRPVIWVKYDRVPRGNVWVRDGAQARVVTRE